MVRYKSRVQKDRGVKHIDTCENFHFKVKRPQNSWSGTVRTPLNGTIYIFAPGYYLSSIRLYSSGPFTTNPPLRSKATLASQAGPGVKAPGLRCVSHLRTITRTKTACSEEYSLFAPVRCPVEALPRHLRRGLRWRRPYREFLQIFRHC